jgi:hypothetical protein
MTAEQWVVLRCQFARFHDPLEEFDSFTESVDFVECFAALQPACSQMVRVA